jgi:apoptosis-inducing factor 2
VVIVGQSDELLPGFLPEVRQELHRQLDELGIELRLGTGLSAPPPIEPGRAGHFTVTTDRGEPIEADIWFRAYGVQVNTGYLADENLTTLTDRGLVRVDKCLNVEGYDHVFALGDIVDRPDPKMASYAMAQAQVVVQLIKARLAPHPRILIPLGTRGGVGQLGDIALTREAVYERKGADLFTARFSQRGQQP